MACNFAALIQNNNARITSFRALRGFGKTFEYIEAASGIATST